MTVLIIGGSSGMGLALAEHLRADGTVVTVASRSGTGGLQADIGREDQVRDLMAAAAPFDHVVVTAVDATRSYAPLTSFELRDAQAVIDTKLLGPWLVAKHATPYLPPTGSLTFTSGVAAYRPTAGGSVAAAVNGALEALCRALAVELAPIRVNIVSPGWTDTSLWDTIAGDERADQLSAMAARLPAGRVGRPDDVADVFLMLIRNGFMTGTVVHADGGQRLV
jgi:NAD(P)-dependent dehydrogenase (short-subunit alcohol dehydrogenase family)